MKEPETDRAYDYLLCSIGAFGYSAWIGETLNMWKFVGAYLVIFGVVELFIAFRRLGARFVYWFKTTGKENQLS